MILRGNVFSTSLMMDTGITVLTPGGHERRAPYKIVYLLHGVCGCNTNFVDHTMLAVHAAKYPCVIVMPDGHRSFYADMAYGQKFFTYVAEELPRICKRTFNISAAPEDTFIMGGSMGGYGALKCALTYPDQYAACCALAPGSLYMKEFMREMREHDREGTPLSPWGELLIGDFRAAFGSDFTWSEGIELLELAKRIQNQSDAPKFYSVCGTDDDLLGINRQFARDMEPLPIDFTYEEMDGGHNWPFFDAALEKALAFALGQAD